MKIWFTDYQLFPKGMDLEKDGDLLRGGALLRIEFSEGEVGYADLCPHLKFGDAPTEVQLRNLYLGHLTPLLKQSLACARMDAEARKRGESLFNDSVIKNHFLISNFLEFDLNRIRTLQGQGYTEFKIKLGGELALETEMLKSFIEKIAMGVKVRLDFNSRLTEKNFAQWLQKNLAWLKPSVEYFEDPFRYDPRLWAEVAEKFSVPLAVDFGLEAQNFVSDGASVVVVKPAVQNFETMLEKFQKQPRGKDLKYVFTHYLDFPVGQMFALAEAQKYKRLLGPQILNCGLQHQEFYESFQFQNLIGANGAFVVPPTGPGLGFAEALEKQEWHALK